MIWKFLAALKGGFAKRFAFVSRPNGVLAAFALFLRKGLEGMIRRFSSKESLFGKRFERFCVRSSSVHCALFLRKFIELHLPPPFASFLCPRMRIKPPITNELFRHKSIEHFVRQFARAFFERVCVVSVCVVCVEYAEHILPGVFLYFFSGFWSVLIFASLLLERIDIGSTALFLAVFLRSLCLL